MDLCEFRVEEKWVALICMNGDPYDVLIDYDQLFLR